MPSWLVIVMQLLTVLPQVAPELEAFIKALLNIKAGEEPAKAQEAAQALVDKVSQS